MPPEAALADETEEHIDDAHEGEEGGEQQAAESSEEAIRVASLMGWKPKSQWRGDASNWRPAEDFLAEVPEVMRNTRKANERMKGQLDRIVGQVAKLTTAEKSRMDNGQEQALEAAIEAGDTEGAKKILAAARRGAVEPDKPSALAEFEERNASWYNVDDEATAYTAAMDRHYAQAAGGVKDPEAHMKKVEAAVKRRFPELFEAADGDGGNQERETGERRRAPLVNRGGRGDRPRSSGGISVADMTPAQRKAAAEMGVKNEDWAKAYNQMLKA